MLHVFIRFFVRFLMFCVAGGVVAPASALGTVSFLKFW